MKREIYGKLIEWKSSPRRKPLILRGARQVGKTYILKEFAANEYESHVYVNFEDDARIKSVFDDDLGAEKIIEYLEIKFQKKIIPHETLIVFDEIQASTQTLKALKYFNEKLNEYHVATAGSLLGISLAGAKSFPVGKVNFLDLYPLSFSEFIVASEKERLLEVIPEINKRTTSVSTAFHEELVDMLKVYYYVGGMPEPVSDYLTNKDFFVVREIQNEILNSYVNDFAKHASKGDAIKIKQIWDSIPLHLSKENRNFIFSAMKSSARAREYETALQWLLDAGLIIKTQNISRPQLPLKAYVEKQFKVYLLDVGLLGAMTELSPELLLYKSELFSHFKGALVENFVMQQLRPDKSLYYWSSHGKAEVDLVINVNDAIIPVEVKAGVNLKAKSLSVYDQAYHPPALARCSLGNFKWSGKLLDFPLYAIGKLIDGKFD